MISRTFDKELVKAAVDSYQKDMIGFHPDVWIDNEMNIAVTDGENVGLFEHSGDDFYNGHYFFVARGKAALEVARLMIDYFFHNTKAQIIRGLCPIGHLGSRWMTRQLGFKSLGAINTHAGYCEMFYLTRQDWQKDT